MRALINPSSLAVLVSFGFLTACSSTSTIQQLQNEYNNHKYSRYVTDNLKALPVTKQAQPTNDKALKIVQRQLSIRKNKAGAQLNGVINHNGLYQPSYSVQQQIVSLRNGELLEGWLKTHSSLDSVLTIALKRNLDIKSAKEQAQSSLAKYDQVAYLDDMLSQYSAFTKDIKLVGSTQKHKKSVSSSFPFPGLLALKSSIIDQATESSRLALKQTVQDVITNTRMAYYELQFAQQEIVITREIINLLTAKKQDLENNYSSNFSKAGGLSSILQVDIQIDNSRNTLQVTKDRKLAQQAKINALLNLSSSFSLGHLDKSKAETLVGTVGSFITIGKENRVEITRLKSDLEKMKRVIQLSKKRFYPDFDAGFSRFQNDKFTVKPKIKKGNFFGKNDAYLLETRTKYKALKYKVRALQNKTAEEVHQVASNYQSQKSTYDLYNSKVLPKARTSLEVAKSLYETGEISYTNVINARKAVLSYRLKSYKALMGIKTNKAKLERLLGSKKVYDIT